MKLATLTSVLILMLKQCDANQSGPFAAASCPKNTFVQKIIWGEETMLFKGVEMHCYAPSSLTPDAIIRTNGYDALNYTQECVAVRGYQVTHTPDIYEFVYDFKPYCSIKDSQPKLPYPTRDHLCEGKTALTGITASPINGGPIIGSLRKECREVDDIEKICPAQDKTVPLITCDASSAQATRKCPFSATTGYGLTDPFTESLRKEYTFYQEFDFDLDLISEGLALNFRQNLRNSNITGYDWTNTSESTFYRETTITAEVEAAPGCITTVTGVVGACSFIQVRPAFLEREDNCNNVKFTTVEFILENFNTNDVFVSKVPEQVLKYLNC